MYEAIKYGSVGLSALFLVGIIIYAIIKKLKKK